MAVNPIRGYVTKPVPGAFWWEGACQATRFWLERLPLPVGPVIAKLGDWRFVDDSLPPIVARLEANPTYPFDFMYAQSTHPIRVDNGPPDFRMPAFVQDWNAEDRTPRIEFTTPPPSIADSGQVRRRDSLAAWRLAGLVVGRSRVKRLRDRAVSRANHEHLLSPN